MTIVMMFFYLVTKSKNTISAVTFETLSKKVPFMMLKYTYLKDRSCYI